MAENGKKKGGDRKRMLMMVVALTLVTMISAALLGLTDNVTRQPIYQAERDTLKRSLEQVLPAHANVPMDDVIHLDGSKVPYYVARDAKGAVKAIAWEVVAPDGYSGAIRILIGVLPDGTLQAMRVTEHHETPGLGDGIVKNKPWIHFFSGKNLHNVRWAVKKDGGDFDQFTGATITPRAVVKAIHKGLLFFAAHRDELLAKAAGK